MKLSEYKEELKWALLMFLIIATAFGITVALFGPNLTTASEAPCYAILEPSGCTYHKGHIQLRIDLYLTDDSPYYHRYYQPDIDYDSEQWQAGYNGTLDDEGAPTNATQYQVWWDQLPRVYRLRPYHSHFIYVDTGTTKGQILQQLINTRDYFYAFRAYCWANNLTFVEEWKKVQPEPGQVKNQHTDGTETEKQCSPRLLEILADSDDYDTRRLMAPQPDTVDLRIGTEGTLDVGSPAIDRGSNTVVTDGINIRTVLDYNNPCNGDGTIDTVQLYAYLGESGNCARAGSFEDEGSASFTCHDGQTLGQASTGFNQYTGLDIDIYEDEYIAADGNDSSYNLWLDRDGTGGGGLYRTNGSQCDPEDNATYTIQAADIVSLYGTGTEGGAAAPDHLVLLPENDTNIIGTNHTFNSTVYDSGNNTLASINITWNLTGVGSILWYEGQTGEDGVAEAIITSTNATGSSYMDCYVTANASVNDTATKYWSLCTATALNLTPQTDTNYCGQNHTITANLTCSGQPGAYHSINWTISGHGSILDSDSTTAANGTAQAIITSSTVGNSTVLCWLSANTSINDTAQKAWVCQAPTSITVTPHYCTTFVGDNRTFWALTQGCGSLMASINVTWNLTGVGSILWCENITGADGRADCITTSNSTGSQNVTCTIDGTLYTDQGNCTWIETAINIPVWYFVILGACVVAAFYTKSLMLTIMAILACGGGIAWLNLIGLPDDIRLAASAALITIIAALAAFMLKGAEIAEFFSRRNTE